MSAIAYEPTEIAMIDRYSIGIRYFGPLTREDAEIVDAFDRHMEELEVEHDAQMAAGGRMICDHCGERAVKHESVCTLGYAGHPGAEFSVMTKCEKCGVTEL